MVDRGTHHRTVDCTHACTTPVADIDHPECGEGAKGHPHHGSTDPKLGREPTFTGQSIADLEVVQTDMLRHPAKRVLDQRAGLAGTSDDAHAATCRMRLGGIPKRREKARVKLALLR